jgi:hypothetical protein
MGEGYTCARAVKALGMAYRLERQFHLQGFLRDMLEVAVSRSVCNFVDVRVQEGREWRVTRKPEDK